MANNVHTLATDLPVLGRFDEFLKRGNAAINLWRSGYEAEEGAVPAQRSWLKRDQDLALLLPSLARDLAALERQATRTEIVDALLPLNVLPAGCQSAFKFDPANDNSWKWSRTYHAHYFGSPMTIPARALICPKMDGPSLTCTI
jgi:hypothetical protein